VLRKGADIVFVLDVSRSMRARDVLPDRLGQAKQEISSISRAVTGGRRAILLFAASPLVQCPLTSDREAFDALLGMASPELIEEQGTSFRAALDLAGRLLEPASEARMASGVKGEKILVLLSDGEDHAGEVQRAVQQLKKANVHLFVIGVGMRQPAVIPLGEAGNGVKRDERGRVVMSSFRGEVLQMLARDAAGYYFRSSAEHAVYREVSERINRIAASSRWVMEPGEREPLYRYFLAAGLFFLLVETMIGRGVGKRRQ
jgi:Ca-activated chloride channel family protein